jgi:hypothetical protein
MGGTPHGYGGFFIVTLAHTIGIASLVQVAGNAVLPSASTLVHDIACEPCPVVCLLELAHQPVDLGGRASFLWSANPDATDHRTGTKICRQVEGPNGIWYPQCALKWPAGFAKHPLNHPETADVAGRSLTAPGSPPGS